MERACVCLKISRTVGEKYSDEHLPELYLLCREYEATLQVTTDPEEQQRLRRILEELRASILRLENR
jgi:hypothetical protein